MTTDLQILPADHVCHNCGACCLRLDIPPFDYDEDDNPFEIDEYIELSPEARAAITAVRDAPGDWPGGPCCWLDLATKTCRHYDERPQACRSFEPGDWACQEDRVANNLPPLEI